MEGGIVAHEGLGQGEGQQFRQQGHGDAADADEDEAFPEKVLQLGVVAGAVVVADHRGAADGVADENGGEDEADVHDGSVGSHAVLAGQLDELEVIEHVHQGGGEVGQHLRGAVPAGPEEDAALQSGPGQAEKAVVFPGEIDQGENPAHGLAGDGGRGGSRQAPLEHGDEQEVQDEVGEARRDGEAQAQVGLFRHHEEALEDVLQDEGRLPDDEDPAVEDAGLHHLPGGAQGDGDGTDEDESGNGQYNAENNGGVDQHGKVAVGVFPVALAQGLGDDGAAAGADHEAHGAHDHQGGEDEVHGGEGGLAHIVGDEQAVHDAVNGGADHHNNGRQDEAQEFGVGEVVGQLDSH